MIASFIILAAVVLRAPWLAVVVAPLLPVVVALVTNRIAAGWLKAGALASLSFLTALFAPVIQSGADFKVDDLFVGNLIVVFLVAAISHFALLKPANITGADGVVARKAPGGIG